MMTDRCTFIHFLVFHLDQLRLEIIVEFIVHWSQEVARERLVTSIIPLPVCHARQPEVERISFAVLGSTPINLLPLFSHLKTWCYGATDDN